MLARNLLCNGEVTRDPESGKRRISASIRRLTSVISWRSSFAGFLHSVAARTEEASYISATASRSATSFELLVHGGQKQACLHRICTRDDA
jgi:hypothetical protein